LKLIQQNRDITIMQMCEKLGMSESGVKKVLAKLKSEKRIESGRLKNGLLGTLVLKVER